MPLIHPRHANRLTKETIMLSSSTVISPTSIAESIHEKGFCVIESVFDSEACEEIRSHVHGYWKAQGSSELKGFGIAIHPGVAKVPALAPFLVHPCIMDALEEAFGEPAEVRHSGVRLSDEHSDPAIQWHHHYAWDPSGLLRRKRCERLLAINYTEGSNDAVGPLQVIPRRIDDPIGEKPQENDPRAVPVIMSPGSVVIFDTAVWHRGTRGNQRGFRTIVGGHYQAKSNLRPHPEDQECHVPNA